MFKKKEKVSIEESTMGIVGFGENKFCDQDENLKLKKKTYSITATSFLRGKVSEDLEISHTNFKKSFIQISKHTKFKNRTL